jgi:hypothetical protein
MTTVVRVTACGNPATCVEIDILDRAISSFQSYRLQPGQTMIQQISASRSIIIRESAVTDTGRSPPLRRRAEGHVSGAT